MSTCRYFLLFLSFKIQKTIDLFILKKSKSQSDQNFFFVNEDFFLFFDVKLGHFKVHTIFSCATNTQA
jgi:hypothetical protein